MTPKLVMPLLRRDVTHLLINADGATAEHDSLAVGVDSLGAGSSVHKPDVLSMAGVEQQRRQVVGRDVPVVTRV